MNKEHIIKLYEKANGWSPEGWDKTVEELERFAKLVAEDEREACAKVLDVMAENDKLSNYYRVAGLAIRERGAP